MKKLSVELGENNYPIYIDSDLLNGSISQFLEFPPLCAIVTNETIASHYLEPLKKQIPNAQIKVILIPDSETSKSAEQYLDTITQLLEAGFNRSSALIALGGGVVGDLTGFIASTLHRGCRYVQVPTSLLAQVDSSVGGKTGINHQLGKNLIGSFYQPEAVFIDPDTLTTLEPRQFNAGMAEVIKYGFISDDRFIPWLENNKVDIKSLQPEALQLMIYHCCSVKAEVVAADEKEQGQRALLNFGHTFGHAIEQVAGYGEWLHGEAVSVGMLMATKLAVSENICEQGCYDRLHALLSFFDLPLRLTKPLSATELTHSMLKDKKNLSQLLRLVLPTGLGASYIENWNDLEAIERLWCEFGAKSK